MKISSTRKRGHLGCPSSERARNHATRWPLACHHAAMHKGERPGKELGYYQRTTALNAKGRAYVVDAWRRPFLAAHSATINTGCTSGCKANGFLKPAMDRHRESYV